MEDEAKEIAELEAQQRGESEEPEEAEEATKEAEADTETKEETLSAEEKSFKKRYGDLRRHMQQKEKEWEKFETYNLLKQVLFHLSLMKILKWAKSILM